MKDPEGTPFPESYIVPPGDYPAHVTVVDTGDHKGNIVYNLKYKLSKDIGKNEYPELRREDADLIPVMDGKKPVMLSGENFVGVVLRGQGIWYTPNALPEDAWKNKAYRQFFEGLGLEFPKEMVAGIERVYPAEVEEEDVLGLPVIITVGQEEYENKKTGKTAYTMKVVAARLDPNGESLDPSELEKDPWDED